jgi:hypothetical protein
VREGVEAELTAVAAETPEWQRWAGWLGVAALLVTLLGVLRPWQTGNAPTGAAAAPLAPRQMVEQVLDDWTTAPVSGTLHRRVWAVDPRSNRNDALVTDVWLGADGESYRVETRKDGELVEWQVADDEHQLHAAADPSQHPRQQIPYPVHRLLPRPDRLVANRLRQHPAVHAHLYAQPLRKCLLPSFGLARDIPAGQEGQQCGSQARHQRALG